MGLFDDIFGGGQQQAARQMRHAQQNAMGQYQSGYNEGMGFLNPQMGEAYGGMNLHQALMDPAAFQQHLMDQYQESPQYQMQREAAEQASRNQMAAQGVSGTTAAEAAGMTGRQQAAQGQQQYLQNAMNTLGMGMGLGGQMAGYRDILAQRLGQGQIGMGEARAAELMGRARGRQGLFDTALTAAGGAMGGGGLKGALGALGY